jgi:SAM-dependent methyltransferase
MSTTCISASWHGTCAYSLRKIFGLEPGRIYTALEDILTAKYFDEYTPEYSLNRIHYATEFIKSHSNTCKSIVDIGCGTGNVLSYIAERVRLQEICGIDIAPSYLEKVKKTVHADVHLGSILDTHFVDGLNKSFDFVLLVAVLHHLVGNTRGQSKKKADLAIRNSLKLTAPEGYLIILEPVFYPARAMSELFYVKRILSKLTSKRIQLFDKWNNIGNPVVSYYTNEDLYEMVNQVSSGKLVSEKIVERELHPLIRLSGVSRKMETTLIVQKICEEAFALTV